MQLLSQKLYKLEWAGVTYSHFAEVKTEALSSAEISPKSHMC